MSSFSPRPSGRADARRNAQRILEVTAELIAADPATTLEQVARRAGISRATVYHHFASRDALLDALTEQSVEEVAAALEAARPDEGSATAAMERMLRAAWQVIGRYRGLVIVNPQRLQRAELRTRLEPALAPVRAVLARGQGSGEFDPDLPGRVADRDPHRHHPRREPSGDRGRYGARCGGGRATAHGKRHAHRASARRLIAPNAAGLPRPSLPSVQHGRDPDEQNHQ